MERSIPVAPILPAHMVPEHATLARLDVGFACTNVVLHANRFVIVPELDGATLWNGARS